MSYMYMYILAALGCSVAYRIYSIIASGDAIHAAISIYSILQYSTTLCSRCKFWYLNT